MKETWAWSSPVWWSTAPYPDSLVTDSLLSYSVQVFKKTVLHQWSIANPVFAAYFDIERQDDEGNWELVERLIPEKGNIPDYHVVEEQPKNGKSFYRLIMHLISGKSDTSSVDSVMLDLDVLGSLVAEIEPFNVARLSWNTKNEKYTERYVIELLQSDEFSTLDEIPVLIEPEEINTVRNYSHLLPDPGVYTYRLKQVLPNNFYKYSDTVSVSWIINGVQDFNVSDFVGLRTNLLQKGQSLDVQFSTSNPNIHLGITDATGRLVRTLGKSSQQVEMKSYIIDLPTGAYFLVVTMDGRQAGLPFIIQ